MGDKYSEPSRMSFNAALELRTLNLLLPWMRSPDIDGCLLEYPALAEQVHFHEVQFISGALRMDPR
jgi:hypothetical protein